MTFYFRAAWLGFTLTFGALVTLDAVAAPVQVVTPVNVPSLRADSMLRSADLRADVAILRRAYTMLHPGLYRYNTPVEIDAAFNALELEFQKDRTLGETYLALSVLAAKVRCGHTYPNFFNQSDAVSAALFREPRVPFYFRWLTNRMIVTCSFSADSRIKAGSEVLAINGVPVAKILAQLIMVARADGHNEAKRVDYMQLDDVDGKSRGQ